MQYILKNLRLFLIAGFLAILAGVTHFSPVNTSAFHANRGLQTEARAYTPENCTEACVLVSQGNSFRSTATMLHADTFHSSVPPGGLYAVSVLSAVLVFYFVFHNRRFNRVRRFQQELALWRF